MSELMAVGQALTMSSQEIADLVESRHDNVKTAIERLAARGVIQLPALQEVRNHLGQAVSVYQLEKRDSYVVVAQLSPEFTARLVDRWQELEAAQATDLSTDEGRLLMIQELSTKQLALVRENKVQAQQLALAAPKVNFFDKVVERTTLMTATQIAQKLGMSAIKLNKLLDELDVYSLNVKRARIFKQWVIDKGLSELKQTELGYSQPLFTTSGEAWIVERLTSEGVA